MDKTRLVCLFVGLIFINSLFFASPVFAGIGASPSTLSFGSVTVNGMGSATFAVTNNGRESIPVDSVTSNHAQFIVTGPPLPITLASHASVIFQVTFQPTSAASFSGTITVKAGPKSGQIAHVSVSGTGVAAGATGNQPATYLLSPSVSSLAFGNQMVGTGASQAITLSDTGTGSVTISQVSSAGSGFSVSGFSGAVTLAAGQSLSLSVGFAPAAAGSVAGNISVVSTATNSPTMISLTGAGVQPLITVAPSTISFGSVMTGASNTQTITVQNPGSATLSVTQASLSGTGYTLSGLSLPLSIAPGGTASFNVGFAPASAGTFSGSLALVSNAPSSPTSVALSGTGVAPTLQLSASPTSLSFGSLNAGSSASQSLTLTNSGNSSVTISQVISSGTGFSVSGFSGAVTLAAGQSLSLSVSFAPTAAGSVSGSISVVSTATNSPTTISLSGTGVQPSISVVPSSVSFGSVITGVTNTQTITVQNPGSATLSVTQAPLTGTGFTLSGLSLPLSIAPGSSASFNVGFAPASAGSFSGSIALTSNAPSSPTSIALSGTGVAATLQLSANPTSLSFGSLTTGTSATQSVTLTNSGNSSVTISQVTPSGAGFSICSIGLPLSLAAGQSTSCSVTFAPSSVGSASGSITVTSNATNSPLVIALSGTGTAPVTYSVSLSWSPSSSSYEGFNVYRGSVSGGPYTKLDSSLIPTASYTDSSVTSGQTYYYVATEVDDTGTESAYSSEVSATIP